MSYELFLDSWDQRGGPEWRVRFGMTSSEYQRFFDEYAPKGFRPTSVSGYRGHDGKSRYVALFEKRSGPAWYAQHGLSAHQFQAKVNEAIREGLRPTFVNAWVAGGHEEFAVGWELAPGEGWVMRHGLDAASYQKVFDEMTGKGLRPRWITNYSFGKEARYAAIFDRSGAGRFVARHNINEETFRAQARDLPSQGYHLICASACSTGTGDVYAGIWVDASGVASEVHHGMTGSAYQLALNNLSAVGARPTFAYGYRGVTPVDVILDFSMAAQEQSDWCWSAVTVGMANYLDGAVTWTQCGLAGVHLDRTDCCSSAGASGPCNVVSGVDRSLPHTGHFAEWKTSDISYSQVKAQLLLNRPIAVMVNWSGTSNNHYVVITGCEDEEFLHVDDPGGGGSVAFIPYSTLQSSYQGSGVWVQTILSK